MRYKVKHKYIDFIVDNINAYRTTHCGFRPEKIFISSALFKILSDGNAQKEKVKFSDIPVVVYDSKEVEFHFVEIEYKINFENKNK